MTSHAELVAAAIRERREELGLLQREVADRIASLNGGKAPESREVSRWETGAHPPSSRNLELVARALETDVPSLLAGGAVSLRLDRIEQLLQKIVETLEGGARAQRPRRNSSSRRRSRPD